VVRASPGWIVGSGAKFHGDGMTSVVDAKTGSLAVTTIPWPVTAADIATEGRAILYTEYVDPLLAEGMLKSLARSFSTVGSASLGLEAHNQGGCMAKHICNEDTGSFFRSHK